MRILFSPNISGFSSQQQTTTDTTTYNQENYSYNQASLAYGGRYGANTSLYPHFARIADVPNAQAYLLQEDGYYILQEDGGYISIL